MAVKSWARSRAWRDGRGFEACGGSVDKVRLPQAYWCILSLFGPAISNDWVKWN